jgi:hypothetical protein
VLVGLAVAAATPGAAATILDWNTTNVDVDPSIDLGVTGTSEVYDRPVGEAGAITNGTIVFTPPESRTPGIKVQPEIYADTGANSSLVFDGCLMTSNPLATCTSEFQSGKRIKQQMTGTGPVDLVFDVDNTETELSFYQVFGRLINVTGQALSGLSVELGTGVGSGFTAFTGDDAPVTFSFDFTAQPNSSMKSSTSQFPFGLFGDADDSPNFLLDGFFSSARTGFDIIQTATKLVSDGYYGEYFALFDDWNDQEDVPQGLFWDFDNNADTDALLMAWQIGDDLWELRRTVGETCVGLECAFGVTPESYETGSFADILALLTNADDPWLDLFAPGAIEDLANLNLNYALALGDFGNLSSFTLRTAVFPVEVSVVPLPAGAPLLLAGLGAFAAFRRRRTAATAA